MKKNQICFLGLFLTFFLTPHVFAATYQIDSEHTTVSFKIRHLFSNVQGDFKQFEGTIQYEPGKPDQASVEAVIQAASIDTNVEQRDKHLRSADFFDVEKFPTITFKSTQLTESSPETGKLEGLLTIHGVEKPVTLDVQMHGAGKDPWGNTRAGFTGTTKINRKDFGLTWNKALESGQVLVGEEVTINLEIEGILNKP
jgi:polyisoprenoid-binding protein YceI